MNDSTIKAVDSHLRLNGVISDIECRDIPIRIRHTPPSRSSGAAVHDEVIDEDGCFTSGFDELLELMTTKGECR